MKLVFYIDMMIRTGAQRVMGILVNNLITDNEIILINDFCLDESIPQYIIDERVQRIYLQARNEGHVISKNLTRIKKLRSIIRNELPDVVISFLGRTNQRMLLSTIGLKTCKIVSVRNDPYKEYGENFIKRFIANLLFLSANGCVFQTDTAKQYFWKRIQEKSTIIYNPIEDIFFSTERKNINGKIIVTFGRIEKQKNHRLLIDAFKIIARYYNDTELFIYGDGQLKHSLEEYCASDKEISDKVHFPGNVSNVNEILSKASLFVLSSDYEGMPNALMESMAVGVPVVSTDCPCGGPKVLIRNETEGILVPCGDKNSLANAIRKLFDDKNLYMIVQENSKIRAQGFRIYNIIQQWLEYIYSVKGKSI